MRVLYVLLLFVISFSMTAQHDLGPCGTVAGKTEWLVNYQKNPTSFPRSDTKLYLPLTLHLVGNSNGDGYIVGDRLLGSLCTLNEDFKDADIQFYIDGDINFIDNNDYFFHNTILEGGQMMFANNVDNSVNNYIVSNAAGNCGYNLPYAGVCLAINCTDPTDHTWAHELGHNFSLPHPFLGWEGGVSHDGSISHNFSDPAPETVLFDYTYFKDTLILDTLIIDTAYVEKVDGSNCAFAADGFCDTSPDYLAVRWACNSDGVSPNGQTDPNGEVFRSDGSLIMSYANDECSSRFTPDQIAAMRANVMDERPGLLKDQSEPVLIADHTVNLLSPKEGAVEDYRYINLKWEAVENATYYIVKVSTNELMTSKLYSEIVKGTETTANVDEAFEGRDLYWSVIPFNKYDFCGTYTTPAVFSVSELSSVDDVVAGQIKFFPSINTSGNIIKTTFDHRIDHVKIFNINGQEVYHLDQVSKEFELPTNLVGGIYFIESNYKGGRSVQKIFIL